jgi:hypothetical protein
LNPLQVESKKVKKSQIKSKKSKGKMGKAKANGVSLIFLFVGCVHRSDKTASLNIIPIK